MSETQVDDFDAISGYEKMDWDEAVLLKTKSDYRKMSTRENLLRWHPQLIGMDEPLQTKCVEWYQNRWDILDIDDKLLKSEVGFNIARVNSYNHYSENWKLFYDSTNKRYIKVYSKKIWSTVPTQIEIKTAINNIFFRYLSFLSKRRKRIPNAIPNILFVSKNYIGVEWLGAEDGWRVCTEEDFVTKILGACIVKKPALEIARNIQKLHLDSSKFFMDRVHKPHFAGKNFFETWRKIRLEAAADRHEYGQDMSHLTNSEHRFYIGSHNYWPKDFVIRTDPTTGVETIRFIDVENLIINDATDQGYWYHKYKISTESYYIKHFAQHVQTIKKHQTDNGPLSENQFLATYIYKDIEINKIITL
jgi:hypothetical protein